MKIDATEPILMFVYYAQLVVVFFGGVGFLIGIFLFLYAFKNPHKKRLAFVLTVLGPIAVLFAIYMPVVVFHYSLKQPIQDDLGLGLRVFEPMFKAIGNNVYSAFVDIAKPLLAFVFLIAVGVLHHASRIPGRKRIGYGIFIGIPVLYTLMVLGPSIIRLLAS